MYRNLLLSFTSALLLVFSWPSGGFPFLIFFALAPLFSIVENTPTKKHVFFYSFIVFALWNSGTTYWIYHASLFGVIAAVLVNSLLMSSVILLFSIVCAKFNDRRAWWAFITFWLGFEYLHLNWDLSWPWLTLGNVFSTYPSVIQWYEYTGVLGGSLWVLLFNVVVYHSFKNKKVYRLPSIILILPFVFNLFISTEEKGEEVNIVVVQPNIDPYFEKFDGLSSLEQLEKFIELAEPELDSTVDYLIGPETAIVDGLWQNKIEYTTELIRLRKLIEKYPQLTIIVGASTYKAYDSNQNLSETARKFINSESYYDVYNSALCISKDDLSIYHKSKLVQGVEFTPFSFLFENLEFLTIDLGGISGSLGTQDYREVFAGKANVAPIICYESIFGEYTSEYVRNGSNLFTIITNDGWWKDTPGYRQHLNYASLRAIECRRPIARSANTGISAFIDIRGKIFQPTKWDEEVVIKRTLSTHSANTFYVRFGDYIGRISAFIAVMFICFTLAKSKD